MDHRGELVRYFMESYIRGLGYIMLGIMELLGRLGCFVVGVWWLGL